MLAAADSGNSEQASKTKTKFPWMYVAASFVGFSLGTVYFNQNSRTSSKMNIVFKTMQRLNRL
jgi:hypothetical protein